MSRTIFTSVAAVIEIVTGLILMVVPSAFARVLFGADLPEAGQAVGRIAGFALLSLGIACRPGSEAPTTALSALVIYNLLITPYLIYVGMVGGPVGPYCGLPLRFTDCFRSYSFVRDSVSRRNDRAHGRRGLLALCHRRRARGREWVEIPAPTGAPSLTQSKAGSVTFMASGLAPQ